MQRRWWMLVAVMVGSSACAADTGTDLDPAASEESELGGLSLPLVSFDSQGREYRLRNATFAVDSNIWYYDGGVPPSTLVSTETDPDADRLTVRLVPGQYAVTLGGDWYIERRMPAGYERVQQVALLSEVTQYAYIAHDWYYDVEFRFGVDGALIDFRHGDLNIDIGIELPGEGPYPQYDGGVGVTDSGGFPFPLYPPPWYQ